MDDEGYAEFEAQVRERIKKHVGPLFTTDVEGLWEAYLDGLPAERRQHYNCNCCRRFIQKYGGLVTANGPLLWAGDAPEFFRVSAYAMYAKVATAKITGVFLSNEGTWGTPQTGEWTHLSGQAEPYKNKLLTADQAMAEKRQDYIMLCNALVDYNRDVVMQALRILRADAVLRSEKALGVAEWFDGLHAAIADKKGKQRVAILWQAVAAAPPGFCHIRSTIISTLLDDIKAGLGFTAIARRWTEKVHPLRYQRPVAPPTSGAIEVAEKLVEKLGIAPSLERRFATMADVLSKLWEPSAEAAKPVGGIFAHLKPKQAAATLDIPGGTISWQKFLRDVLPSAKSLAIEVPRGRAPFYGLVTAVHADAPPIIQWDVAEQRNPVSWYVYTGGSPADHWNLVPGSLAKVTAVFLPPHQWQYPGKFTNHEKEVFFALENCWDTKSADKGLALFPEILKSELHGIRSVIEAHSAKSGIADPKLGNANGLSFYSKTSIPLNIRVGDGAGTITYQLNRWE